MKIYGHFLSAPANKVRLTASALGLDFDYQQLDLTKGEHKSPEYLKVNPVGKVPALEDDGFCLFESNAICRYLGNKTQSNLYPQESQQRAVVDQWIDFSSHHILTNMGKILFNTFFAPMMGATPSQASIDEGTKYLNQQLPVIENQLQQTPMLSGNEMTIADISMLAAMEPFEFIKFDITAYPAINAWRNNLMQQDFYKNIHAHYAAELPPTS